MARPVTVWLGATTLACAVLAAAMLPPRGVPKWAWTPYREQPENASRIRARLLAAEWRQASAELTSIRYRAEVARGLQARQAAGHAGPILILADADTLAIRTRPFLQAGLDSAWSKLGIGESKIHVAVIGRDPLKDGRGVRLARISVDVYGTAWILPDSAERTTCMVLTEIPHGLENKKYGARGEIEGWSVQRLGPCAFYARFGMPSARVEQWLIRNQFDVALIPAWNQRPERARTYEDDEEVGVLNRWFSSMYLYSYQPLTLGCMAGRPESCRRVLATNDLGPEGPRPRTVAPRDRWNTRVVRLFGADHFLSEVMQQAGPERFQEFWTTSLPVDSALTLALRQPVGEFVAGQRRMGDPTELRFGAATTPLDGALGLAFAALVVGLVMLAQGRRQVQ